MARSGLKLKVRGQDTVGLTSMLDRGQFSSYIRQVNGVKLADILFYLSFRPSIRPSVRPSIRLCALIFRCKYLENGLRWRLGTNYPLIGNAYDGSNDDVIVDVT